MCLYVSNYTGVHISVLKIGLEWLECNAFSIIYKDLSIQSRWVLYLFQTDMMLSSTCKLSKFIWLNIYLNCNIIDHFIFKCYIDWYRAVIIKEYNTTSIYTLFCFPYWQFQTTTNFVKCTVHIIGAWIQHMCPYIWYTIEEFELASDIFNFKSKNIVIRHEKGGGWLQDLLI